MTAIDTSNSIMDAFRNVIHTALQAAGGAAAVTFSDRCMFPLFEIALFVLFLYSMWRSWRLAKPRKRVAISVMVEVKPSERGRALFYGFYTAISVVVLNIPLRVEVESARNYRVAWVLFNLSTVAYICLFNSWFRNTITGWVNRFENKTDRFAGG